MASSVLTSSVADKLVAVIGAGVAGLACASCLAEQGFLVTVFDSGRGPGGRMSQRRERASDGKERDSDGKVLCFDHGVQYFTVKDSTVQGLVDKWESAGVVAEWKGKFGAYDTQTRKFMEDTDLLKKRYVGVPGMNAVCQALSQQTGIQTKFSVTVGKLDWKEQEDVWALADKDGKALGEFWAVVATDKNLASPRFTLTNGIPPPLAGAVAPSLLDKVAGATSSSCFAVMLAFPEPLTSFPFDGFTVSGSEVLAWAARDSSKPKRDTIFVGECWVLHSTSNFAHKVIEKAGMGKPSVELLSTVSQALLEDFQKIGETPAPVFNKAHRWGSAFPNVSIAVKERSLVDEGRKVAVCGDFCVGPRVECAILSGLSAADKIQRLLKAEARL